MSVQVNAIARKEIANLADSLYKHTHCKLVHFILLIFSHLLMLYFSSTPPSLRSPLSHETRDREAPLQISRDD